VQGTGFLNMTDPGGVLDVLGNVLVDGESTSGTLTAGTLRVGGDFTQLNTISAVSFSADPGHVTAFVGTGTQSVFFASPDTVQSRFGTLRIENTSAFGVQFSSNAAAYGQLVSPSPAGGVVRRLGGGSGIGLVVRGLDADSLIFDGLTLAVDEGALVNRFNAVQFENQDPTATQLFLRRKADAVTFNALSFLTQPSSGLYLDLVDADVTLPPFTVTMTNPNPAAHGGFARTDGLAQLIGWPSVLPAQVLFAADSAGNAVNSGIFKVDGDGANQVQITTEGPPAELNVHPRWSPDRTHITYTARVPGDPNQLHIRSADGVNVFHLTSVTDTSTFFPRYSPNGVHLAFQCGDGGFPTTPQDVCVIADVTNPADGMGDGTGKTYVTDAVDATLGGSGGFAWNPKNPDQVAVVLDSVFAGPTPIFGSVIWLVNFDGSGRTPLGNRVILDAQGAPVQVYSMDWSPDGSFIAFDGTSGGTRSIFRIEVATGVVTQLTTQNSDHTPVISPDNAEIIFGRDNDLWVLMKIPAIGGTAVQMTSNMSFDINQAGWDWSPDGSEIVLTEDITTAGVVISKILPTTTATSFFVDVKPVGRRGGVEIQDRQPSWRP
jgi:Tol biopolymer transport system component